MALILHIETSTNVCSVALSRDGFLLYEKADDGSNGNSNAAERLGGFVSDALERLPDDGKLEAVSVSSGPGSYTGLRIGVSMAKGVCYGSDAQLISVPTLELLCVPVLLGDKIKATSWVDGKEEQLVDSEQTAALGMLLKYAVEKMIDGKKTIPEIVSYLQKQLETKGLSFFADGGYIPCGYAIPRVQEIYACFNRYRRA